MTDFATPDLAHKVDTHVEEIVVQRAIAAIDRHSRDADEYQQFLSMLGLSTSA